MTKHFNTKSYEDLARIFAYAENNNDTKQQLTQRIINMLQRDNPKFSIIKFDKYVEKILTQIQEGKYP